MKSVSIKLAYYTLFLLGCVSLASISVAQDAPVDCNQNSIPDICELDPNSAPEICLIQAGGPLSAADNCADAPSVDFGFYYTSTSVGATLDGSSTCGGSAGNVDVWYKFTNNTAEAMPVRFSLSGSISLPNGMDVVLTIYSACPGNSGSIVACNDDYCGLDSNIDRTINPGETVWLRFADFGSDNPGAFRLNVMSQDIYACVGNVGAGSDCDQNSVLDECDVNPYFGGSGVDCDFNNRPDSCTIAALNGQDYQGQTINVDQNSNGLIDFCEDCNKNILPDVCDLSADPSTQLWIPDGQNSAYPTSCDRFCSNEEVILPAIALPICGQSVDVNTNSTPDECENDCNGNGVPDSFDISSGTSVDCNTNTRPDECDLASPIVATGSYNPVSYYGDLASSLRASSNERYINPRLAEKGLVGASDVGPEVGAADMFYLMFPTATSAGRVLVGPMNTQEGSVKDVAVNHSTGGVFALGLPYSYASEFFGYYIDDSNPYTQYLYQVNTATGAGTPMPEQVFPEDNYYGLGLTFNSDASTLYGVSEGVFTINQTTGALDQFLSEVNGIGMATAPNGEIIILGYNYGAGAAEYGADIAVNCFSGVLYRIDPVTGALLEASPAFDTLSAEAPCRALVDIAFANDGTFYGVTTSYEYYDYPEEEGPSYESTSIPPWYIGGKDLVRIVPFEGEIDQNDLADAYGLETVGPLNLDPLGLGGNLPPVSNDCDVNNQPDECQPDCDADGTPDACETDSDNNGIPDDCVVDCAGVVNGPAVLDRCGVCNGNGQSCLGCETVNITSDQFIMDGNAHRVRGLATFYASKLKKVSPATAKSVKLSADKFYSNAWTITWTELSPVVTQCANTTFCASVSNAASVNGFSTNVNGIKNAALKAIKKLKQSHVFNTSQYNKAKRRIEKATTKTLNHAAGVPVTQSVCS